MDEQPVTPAQVAAMTLVIPSVGPGYGQMLDQARILRGFAFPTAMLLPTREPTTPAGVERAVDPFLSALVDAVGAERIVSGIGEQPAIAAAARELLQFELSLAT